MEAKIIDSTDAKDTCIAFFTSVNNQRKKEKKIRYFFSFPLSNGMYCIIKENFRTLFRTDSLIDIVSFDNN